MRSDVPSLCGAALAAVLSASPAGAAPPGQAPGLASTALPGIVRVPHPTSTGETVNLAAGVGYGLTEEIGADDGTHHRMMGSIAGAYSPISELGFGLRFDGRVDLHPDAPGGADSGAVGDPRAFARAGTPLGRSIEVGVDLTLWLPGNDAPSLAFDATSMDARGIIGVLVGRDVVIDASAGYRLDNSARAIDDADRLSFSDRISLGLSDFDAVLLGAGAAVRLSAFELLAEVTAEPLVGSGAPSFSESALRVDLGVRRAVGKTWWIGGIAEASLAGRPAVGAGSPMVPVEPRFGVFATLAHAFELSARAEAPAAPASTPAGPAAPLPAQKPPPPAEKTERDVVIRVHDGTGQPIVDADVRVFIGEREFSASVVEGDVYRADSVSNGEGRLLISAPGFRRVEQEITARGDTMELEVELEPATQTAQLRGLVRAFSGAPIPATIRVEPGDHVLAAGKDGTFAVDLEPGVYRVTISAAGYRDQRRSVRVEKGGVVILNSELLKE